MEENRFVLFTSRISALNKGVQKIKLAEIEHYGLKAVHIIWVYLLAQNPEGYTCAELARQSQTDRSLISRELDWLCREGIVQVTDQPEPGKRRQYNQNLLLTEKGYQIADVIERESRRIQAEMNHGIPEEDLNTFYRVFNLLTDRMNDLCRDSAEKKK